MDVIPRAIHEHLEILELPVLYEIRDLVLDLIRMKEEAGRSQESAERIADRVILEERHSGSMTYRLERVSCGKKCKGCPHGPYWYGYWREGGKTRSKYIGKKLR